MEPSELEFLAEQEPVSVIPNFSHGRVHLIRGDCGPFAPGIPVEVPLWLAVNLRQRQKCRIVPPEWLSVAALEEAKKAEADSPDAFTHMPCEHYREVAQLLFDVAASDVPDADETRALVKDIWDIRMAKLRSSVDGFVRSEASRAQVDNLTRFEISFVRPLLSCSLYQLHKFQEAMASMSQNDSQSQSASSSLF